MRGWSANASSSGQLSTSAATTSRTVASYARMRSPWNGGSISRRRARCSRPSSRSSEREPTIGCSAIVRPGRQRVAGNGVERADRVRVGEHHHRRLEAEEADAERVAVAPPAGLQERDRAQQPAQGLHERRLGWPWRQRAHRRTARSRARPGPIRRAAPSRPPPPEWFRVRARGRARPAPPAHDRQPRDDAVAARARRRDRGGARALQRGEADPRERLAEYAQRDKPHVLKQQAHHHRLTRELRHAEWIQAAAGRRACSCVPTCGRTFPARAITDGKLHDRERRGRLPTRRQDLPRQQGQHEQGAARRGLRPRSAATTTAPTARSTSAPARSSATRSTRPCTRSPALASTCSGATFINEGVTQYFTDLLLREQGLAAVSDHQYGPELACATSSSRRRAGTSSPPRTSPRTPRCAKRS